MTVFNGLQSAGILVVRQTGGISNQCYAGEQPGDFNQQGLVLDSSFRAGEQRGPNIEIALYGSNCEVTAAGRYDLDTALLNGQKVTTGPYNALVVKKASDGFCIVRLVNGVLGNSVRMEAQDKEEQ